MSLRFSGLRFYGKKGCINNRRQKALLTQWGLAFSDQDLLATPWTEASLQPYLAGHPVSEWFNRSAPAVKAGDVCPDTLGEAEAMSLLLSDHLLIRRPLLSDDQGNYLLGFEPQAIQQLWVDGASSDSALPNQPLPNQWGDSLETCAREQRVEQEN